MTFIDDEIKRQTEYVQALSYQLEQLSIAYQEGEHMLRQVENKYRSEKRHLDNLIAYVNKGNN